MFVSKWSFGCSSSSADNVTSGKLLEFNAKNPVGGECLNFASPVYIFPELVITFAKVSSCPKFHVIVVAVE